MPTTEKTHTAEAKQAPTRYYWKQCYGMDEGVFHWALCDDESAKEGKVSCAYMVLLADYPNGVDGKPVGQQFIPAKIIDALNSHAALLARNESLTAANEGMRAELEWIEATAVNLHCALQATAHMDPNDKRIAVETVRVVRDLLVIRDRARSALTRAASVEVGK